MKETEIPRRVVQPGRSCALRVCSRRAHWRAGLGLAEEPCTELGERHGCESVSHRCEAVAESEYHLCSEKTLEGAYGFIPGSFFLFLFLSFAKLITSLPSICLSVCLSVCLFLRHGKSIYLGTFLQTTLRYSPSSWSSWSSTTFWKQSELMVWPLRPPKLKLG